MISSLLIVYKLLSEFRKGQIVPYNDYGLSLCDTAKKLSSHHSSIDVFLKNYEKTGNYHSKKGHSHKRKIIAPEDTKIVGVAK